MKIRRLLSPLFAIVFFAALVSAQTPDEKKETDKLQTALLEQIAKDADGLRVPENRAMVALRLGEGLWKHDEKRARAYFQTAINELIRAQTDAEANKKQAGVLYGLINGTSPRQEILMTIAARDAAFALDAFYKTRPPKIARLLEDAGEKKKFESQQNAQTELNFEQSLINRVGDQDPQRALKLIRDSLAKGVTYEAVSLIEKLKAKDMEAAEKFAAEVGEKLVAADYEKDSQTFNIASAFVAEYGKKPEGDEKPVKVDEKILRDLTAKVAAAFLKSEENYYDIEYILHIAERFAPNTVAALKQKKAKYDKENQREEYESYSKLIESEPTAEKLLSEADKFSDEYKNQLYYSAAEKFAQSGNVAQAQKIIKQKLPEEDGENYLSQINMSLISTAMSEGRFDEANLLINNLPQDNTRFYNLISLATAIYQKNPAENKKRAAAVIEQARALIAQPAETVEDINLLIQVAATLAEIEPEQSFQILESLVFPINEFVEAQNVVSKYRNDGNLRQGEMVVNNYGTIANAFNLNQILPTLKNKDLKRLTAFVNNFSRAEVRIGLEMQLVDYAPPADTRVDAPPVIAPAGTSVIMPKN